MVFCDRTRTAGDSQFLGVTALSAVPYELYTANLFSDIHDEAGR